MVTIRPSLLYADFLKDMFLIAIIFALVLALYPRLAAMPSALGKNGMLLLLPIILFVALFTILFEFLSLWIRRGDAVATDLLKVFAPGQEPVGANVKRVMLAMERHVMLRDVVLLLGMVVAPYALFVIWEIGWR
jgi:hypothetical protein